MIVQGRGSSGQERKTELGREKDDRRTDGRE